MTDTSPDAADLLYGVPAIAAHLGIRPRQAEHQIHKGGLPTFRVGGVICARKSSIAAWLAEREAEAQRTRRGGAPGGDAPSGAG